MLADADLSTVAELMSGHRATLLLALIGGHPLTASELAARAGISRSLTSSHLSRLLDGGLIDVTQEGRQRHYRLAGPAVAEVIEGMLTIAPQRAAPSHPTAARGNGIRHARTCYDHLAGILGVAICDALEHQRILEPADNSYRVTSLGEKRLASLGLNVDQLRTRRRAFARPCLDWTERRPHLAGALGAGLTDRLIELDWVRRTRGSRAVHLTRLGQQRLRDELALNITAGA